VEPVTVPKSSLSAKSIATTAADELAELVKLGDAAAAERVRVAEAVAAAERDRVDDAVTAAGAAEPDAVVVAVADAGAAAERVRVAEPVAATERDPVADAVAAAVADAGAAASPDTEAVAVADEGAAAEREGVADSETFGIDEVDIAAEGERVDVGEVDATEAPDDRVEAADDEAPGAWVEAGDADEASAGVYVADEEVIVLSESRQLKVSSGTLQLEAVQIISFENAPVVSDRDIDNKLSASEADTPVK
jgi:hypothetical protein